jgi:hypothetical protein
VSDGDQDEQPLSPKAKRAQAKALKKAKRDRLKPEVDFGAGPSIMTAGKGHLGAKLKTTVNSEGAIEVLTKAKVVKDAQQEVEEQYERVYEEYHIVPPASIGTYRIATKIVQYVRSVSICSQPYACCSCLQAATGVGVLPPSGHRVCDSDRKAKMGEPLPSEQLRARRTLCYVHAGSFLIAIMQCCAVHHGEQGRVLDPGERQHARDRQRAPGDERRVQGHRRDSQLAVELPQLQAGDGQGRHGLRAEVRAHPVPLLRGNANGLHAAGLPMHLAVPFLFPSRGDLQVAEHHNRTFVRRDPQADLWMAIFAIAEVGHLAGVHDACQTWQFLSDLFVSSIFCEDSLP